MSNVRVTGLEIRPQNPTGNTGILVENGPRTRLENNRVIGFGRSIWLAGADKTN